MRKFVKPIERMGRSELIEEIGGFIIDVEKLEDENRRLSQILIIIGDMINGHFRNTDSLDGGNRGEGTSNSR